MNESDKAVLQQALDAFEIIFETTVPYQHDGNCTFSEHAINTANKAIAALESAIAQPKQPAKTKLGTIGHTAYAGFGPMTDAFFLTQISQPEQPTPAEYAQGYAQGFNNACKAEQPMDQNNDGGQEDSEDSEDITQSMIDAHKKLASFVAAQAAQPTDAAIAQPEQPADFTTGQEFVTFAQPALKEIKCSYST